MTVSSIRNLLFIIATLAAGAFGQSNLTPQPILVDVIGGGRATSSRTVRVSGAPNLNYTGSLGSANSVEARAFQLMNAERQANGLGQLAWDDQIVSLARSHSASMATEKYFSHRDTGGGYVDDRAAKLGIFNWLAIGENIAFMKGYPDPAMTAVEKWMKSPSHKKNILNGQWRESAIGVAVADDGAIYFTQIFISK